MNEENICQSATNLRFNFSKVEDRLNAIFVLSKTKLDRLCSEERIQSFKEHALIPYLRAIVSTNDSLNGSPKVKFQLRLGTTRLTLDELSRLEPNVIVPLLNSTNGQIQIWSNRKQVGTGVLRIANGKLVVKIVTFKNN